MWRETRAKSLTSTCPSRFTSTRGFAGELEPRLCETSSKSLSLTCPSWFTSAAPMLLTTCPFLVLTARCLQAALDRMTFCRRRVEALAAATRNVTVARVPLLSVAALPAEAVSVTRLPDTSGSGANAPAGKYVALAAETYVNAEVSNSTEHSYSATLLAPLI